MVLFFVFFNVFLCIFCHFLFTFFFIYFFVLYPFIYLCHFSLFNSEHTARLISVITASASYFVLLHTQPQANRHAKVLSAIYKKYVFQHYPSQKKRNQKSTAVEIPRGVLGSEFYRTLAAKLTDTTSLLCNYGALITVFQPCNFQKAPTQKCSPLGAAETSATN